jgi:hypothetical protein
MQRTCSTTAPQVILLLFLGSYVWAHQLSDNYEMMRLLYSHPGYFKRLPSYDFGLGKRSFEDSSYEETSPAESPSALMDKDSTAAGIVYPFGPGKRNRAYGFGLGKRLMENDWKLASMTPTFRFAFLSSYLVFSLISSESSSFRILCTVYTHSIL